MSLGITAKGQLPLSSTSSVKDVLGEMGRWLQERGEWICQNHDFGQVNILTLELHPGVEALQFHIHDTGQVIFQARTTPVGPGYHQAVVSFFDDFTQAFQIQWDDLSQADGTDFLHHRNERQLEETFTRWLQGFAQFILEHPMEGCVSMDLPHGIRVEAEIYIATTLGPRDQTWLENVCRQPEEHVLDFFPWWSPEQDALFYQGVALTLGWNLLAWRVPQTERENWVMEFFIEACEKADQLQPGIELPRQTWQRCCQWLGRKVPGAAKQEDPIGELGYRHGLIHFPLGAHWSVCLPGIFSQTQGSQLGAWKAWHEKRSVETRVMQLKKKGSVEELLPRFQQPVQGQRITVRNQELGFFGVGDLKQTPEGCI